GVRGPRSPSASARAVGPAEPACAVSAGGASPVLLSGPATSGGSLRPQRRECICSVLIVASGSRNRRQSDPLLHSRSISSRWALHPHRASGGPFRGTLAAKSIMLAGTIRCPTFL